MAAATLQLYYSREIKFWSIVHALLILLVVVAAWLIYHETWLRLAGTIPWLGSGWLFYSLLTGISLIYIVCAWCFYLASGFSDADNWFSGLRLWIRLALLIIAVVVFLSLIILQAWLLLSIVPGQKILFASVVSGTIIDAYQLLAGYKILLTGLFPLTVLVLPVVARLLLTEKVYGHLPPELTRFNSIITLILLLASVAGIYYCAQILHGLFNNLSRIVMNLPATQYNMIQFHTWFILSLTLLMTFVFIQAVKGEYSVLGELWRGKYFRWIGRLLFLLALLLIYGGFLLLEAFDLDRNSMRLFSSLSQEDQSLVDRIVLHVIYLAIASSVVLFPFAISRVRILFLKWTSTLEIFR